MTDITCARCAREPKTETHFDQEWMLVHEQGADFPYCPECIEALRGEGRILVPDEEVGLVERGSFPTARAFVPLARGPLAT